MRSYRSRSSYAHLPAPTAADLAVVPPLFRTGETETGQGPWASLMGALPSSDHILGCPSDSPLARPGVGKPQHDSVRSGWPLASLGPSPGAALGALTTSHWSDSLPCPCSGTALGLSPSLACRWVGNLFFLSKHVLLRKMGNSCPILVNTSPTEAIIHLFNKYRLSQKMYTHLE